MPRDELAAWLRLLLTPGLGRATTRRLLAAFGLPQAVWDQSESTWATVVGGPLAATMTREPEGFEAAVEAHARWLDVDEAHHLVTLGDARFPSNLLQQADPPIALFVHGNLDPLLSNPCVAIVGSRNPTPQGTQNAHAFGKALAQSGLCVVSGLALGIDGAAHTGALDGGGPTIAFVGTGIDRVYPARHRALAHRIVEQGALVSEYLLGTPPLAPNFPSRNRLIAGASLGTLVVEAALQSGSLITARLASEMGREVFAIPGSIHATQARGCHALIRQGAKLVESAQDVLEELQLGGRTPSDNPVVIDSAASNPLLEAMGHDPVGLDALQARTGLDTAHLQAQLLDLELAGEVARLPGGLLQRLSAG
ncbi:MAG: DNA-processing protein DprA [Hydrogenophaga sp.]|uniref:DNA-processing protein DprA n=1 Tax=Hydrogenophaga sp. TaxID=1904254 RepID=UPI001D4ED792|nr:DNA-processing protein DprA [Hydrogenophaga sp.]MBX3608403.1 DNA-processing protein DprA [Hydrogenophaga sp.]